MENTTIALTKEIKDKMKEFGNKGETYSDILVRLIESANQRLLQDVLMDETDTVSIEKALDDAKKRWRK